MHRHVRVDEHNAVAALRTLGPIEHAAEEVQRINLASHLPPVLLRREPCRASGCPAPLLPAKLLVVNRIRLPQALVLLLGERNVAGPLAHAALRHAELRFAMTPSARPVLSSQPPCCLSLDRFHERMFASAPDAWNYTHKRSAPMV